MEVDDMRFTIMLIVSIIFAVALLLRKLSNRVQKNNKQEEDAADDDEDEAYKADSDDVLFEIMRKMKPIISSSARAIWSQKHDEVLLTTDMSKDFCANRANRFIASTEDSYLFLKCVWQDCNEPKKIVFHDIMESPLYSL
eukprot:273747_1